MSEIPLVSIVDDDDSVRAAMSSLVRSLGYDACVFASAEAFLTSPQLTETACLILDVQMPKMSGLDLQAELQARRSTIPVIFITAFPEEHIRRRAEAAGAIGFFGKPVDGHTIIRCLDEALSTRRTSA
ncbi:response regulator [Reyranella sp.]|uniref:response regulator transcription factor n=1 Tax=Reyranella sp. TaxID=1929291 RepID=UPI0025E15221|nr:response regulator [Reyranella sp.]